MVSQLQDFSCPVASHANATAHWTREHTGATYFVECEIVQLDSALRGVDVAGNEAWNKGFYTTIT